MGYDDIKLEESFNQGVEAGIKYMQQKILFAYENGNPIDIDGRAYFIRSDMDNLRDIFEDLEADADQT